MAASHTPGSKLMVTGISLILGLAVKWIMRKGWQSTYQEDPPGEIMDEDLNWFKLFMWTLLTGLLLRMIKVTVKRSLSIYLLRQKVLH